ncbi:MAG: hypothetical protein GXZ05_08685 [Gammaproteobacteria bacterium]|nr:hypothetical protein [Gammaproteobacteria bacterium]
MHSKRGQRGVVLIVVLWVVALLTILLAAFVATVRVERQSVADVSLGIQARAAVDGVVNYLAALTAVNAPELEEMPGHRYELMLNELNVSFRLVPESVFVPINTLDVQQLETVFAGMGLEQPAERAAQVVEWRNEELEEDTGELRPAIRIRSLMHLAHLLELDIEQIRPYERWLSFWGEHQGVAPGYVPDEVLDALGLQVTGEDSGQLQWDPAGVYRVQVEVDGGRRPRQIEAIASFSDAEPGVLQINEYNAVFSLNDLSE